MPDIDRATKPIPLITKLAYGSGTIAFGVKDVGFQTFLMLYYNQVIGLPASLVGGAIMLALVVDTLFDPIIGHWSDNVRTRWGRRHPFMYAAALPAALSYAMLWSPPSGWSESAMFGYIFCVAIVVRSCLALYEIPSAALVAEMTPDYDERTSILSYRMFFGYAGGIGMTTAAYLLFLVPENGVPGQLNRAGYGQYGIAAALVIAASILLAAIGTHRRIPLLRADDSGERRKLTAVGRDLVEAFRNRSLAAVMLAGLFNAVATGMAGALNIYMYTYFWEFTARQISLLTVPVLLGAVAATIAAPLAARGQGKKRAAAAFLIVAVTALMLPLLLRAAGLAPADGSSALVALISATVLVAATCGVGYAILLMAMIADVVEDSAVRTGRRSEGLFFSVQSLIQKGVSGAGVFTGSLILQAIAFPQQARPGGVAREIVDRLPLIYAPTYVVFTLFALICLNRYAISRDVHERNVAMLLGKPAAPRPADETEGAKVRSKGSVR